MRLVMMVAACLTLTQGPIVAAQERPFDFGLMGDTGYTAKGIDEFGNLIAAVNKVELAFVVHVGDFEADGGGWSRRPDGPMPCTTESYERVFRQVQTVRHPFILTPGDNDWTDCGKITSAKIDSLEALSTVRNRFYPEGKSLGQSTMPVESQSKNSAFAKFKENLRWAKAGVLFATLHIVGSNDNLSSDPVMMAEQNERKAANIAWMREAFAQAKGDGSRGVVFITQANPGFENYWPQDAKARYFAPFVGRGSTPAKPESAFDDYVNALSEEMEGFGKPVAYLHGDTHLHRVDKPLYSKKTGRAFENFTRVETFGAPDTHWVLVRIDPTDPQVFTFRGEIVKANRAN